MAIQRCFSCHATVKDGETACWACSAPIIVENPKATYAARFAVLVKIVLFLSLGLTIASLFVDFTPSFTKCIAASLILFFVKNSADQMAEKRR